MEYVIALVLGAFMLLFNVAGLVKNIKGSKFSFVRKISIIFIINDIIFFPQTVGNYVLNRGPHRYN